MARQVKTTNKEKSPAKAVKRVEKKSAKQNDKEQEKKPAKKTEKKDVAGKTEQVKVKYVTTAELAKFVGVTERRIQQQTQDGVIQKEPGIDKYDFVRNVHSLMQYYRQKADSRRSSDSEDLAVEKRLQISVKRKLEELKLAQLEKELHKAEDIERIVGAVLTRLRINLLAIPMGVAPLVREMDDAREIAEKLDERIRRAMNEVADMNLEKLVDEDISTADDYDT